MFLTISFIQQIIRAPLVNWVLGWLSGLEQWVWQVPWGAEALSSFRVALLCALLTTEVLKMHLLKGIMASS